MEPGIYTHYKGKQYEVIGVARHSETMEELVVYKALYESPGFGYGAIWVRPKSHVRRRGGSEWGESETIQEVIK